MKQVGSPAPGPEEANKAPPSLTHRAVSGMAWVAWGSAASAVLRLAVLVLLTRLLSATDFGLVNVALIVIGFSLTFSQLGLGPALTQRPTIEPRHVSTAFAASTGFGLLIAALMWLLAPGIAAFFRMDALTPVVRALALVFPIDGLSTVAQNLLQRELRFRFLSNAEVAAYGLGYGVVGLGLAYIGWGVWSLVAAQLAQAVVRAVIFLAAMPPRLHPRPTWSTFRELFDFGMGQSAGRIAWFLANQADNFVVARWMSVTAVGIYGRAYQLMAVPTTLLGDVLDKVLFPTMSQVQNDAKRLAGAYLQGTALIALVTLPVGVVAAVLAPDLVRVAFGPGWEAAVPPFQILALGMMFRTSHRMSDSLARATGRVYRRAWRQALYAALVFAGAWVGRSWGLSGVAAGVLVALFANYLMMAHLSLSVGQISWSRFAAAQLPALGLSIVLGAVSLAALTGLQHLGWPPLANLVLVTVAVLGTAGLLLQVAPALVLGEHGLRISTTLRAYVTARLRPSGARGAV